MRQCARASRATAGIGVPAMQMLVALRLLPPARRGSPLRAGECTRAQYEGMVCMNAGQIRRGQLLDGARVDMVVPCVVNGRPGVRLRAGGVWRKPLPLSASVRVGGPRTLAAGPTREGWFVGAKPKVRVSEGVWEGERNGTRRDMVIATHPAFAGYGSAA